MGDGENDGDDELATDAMKMHWLMVHLHDGGLSFQVVSCTREFRFRIYPTEAGSDGFFRLVRSSPLVITAGIGGEHDGHGHNFYINEKPGTVVRISVFFSDSTSKRQGATVWYVVKRNFSGPEVLVSLSQAKDKQQPKFKLDGTSEYSVKILEDVEGDEENYHLIKEAFQLSENYFTTQFDIKVVTGGRH